MFELVFNEFTKKYDFKDSKIRLKYNHSFRVRNLSLKYAYLLNFSPEDKKLAEFIGLYHDIGRFTQLEKYNTYDDSSSIDHAQEGIKVLFEEGLINKFDFTDYEKEIIRFAISNHNKFVLEDCNDERKTMHAKLIRDTDKLDIIYLFAYLDDEEIKVSDEKIEEKYVESFKKHEPVKYDDNGNMEAVKYFGFAFDLNYDECVSEFINNITEFYKRLNNENVFKEIFDIALEYIERRN